MRTRGTPTTHSAEATDHRQDLRAIDFASRLRGIPVEWHRMILLFRKEIVLDAFWHREDFAGYWL